MLDPVFNIELSAIRPGKLRFSYDVDFEIEIALRSEGSSYYPVSSVAGTLTVKGINYDHGNRVNHPRIEEIEFRSRDAVKDHLAKLVEQIG